MQQSSSSLKYSGRGGATRSPTRGGKSAVPAKTGNTRTSVGSDSVTWLSKDEQLPTGLSFQDYKTKYNVSSYQVDLLVQLLSDLFRASTRDKVVQQLNNSMESQSKWYGTQEGPPIFTRVYSHMKKENTWIRQFKRVCDEENKMQEGVVIDPELRKHQKHGGAAYKSKLCDDILQTDLDSGDEPSKPQQHDHIGAGLLGISDVQENLTIGLHNLHLKINTAPERGPISGSKLTGTSADLLPEASSDGPSTPITYSNIIPLPQQPMKPIFTMSAQTLLTLCAEIHNTASTSGVSVDYQIQKKTNPILTHCVQVLLAPYQPQDMVQRCVFQSHLLSCSSVKAADTLMLALPALLSYKHTNDNETKITNKDLPKLFLLHPIAGYAYNRQSSAHIQDMQKSPKASRLHVLLASIYHYAQEQSVQRQTSFQQSSLLKQNSIVQLSQLKVLGEAELEVFSSNNQEHQVAKSLYTVLHASLAQMHHVYPLEAYNQYGELGKKGSTPLQLKESPIELYHVACLACQMNQFPVSYIPPSSLLLLLSGSKEALNETAKLIGLAMNGGSMLTQQTTPMHMLIKKYIDRNVVYMLLSALASTRAYSRSLIATLYPLVKNVLSLQSAGYSDKYNDGKSDAQYQSKIMIDRSCNGVEQYETARRLTSGSLGLHILYPQTKLYGVLKRVQELHRLDANVCSVSVQAYKDAGLGVIRHGVFELVLPLPLLEQQEQVYNAAIETQSTLDLPTLASFILPIEKQLHTNVAKVSHFNTYKSSQPVYKLPSTANVQIIHDDSSLCEAWTLIQPLLPEFTPLEQSLYNIDSLLHPECMDSTWVTSSLELKQSQRRLDMSFYTLESEQTADLLDLQSVAAHTSSYLHTTTWEKIHSTYAKTEKQNMYSTFPCVVGIDVENSPGDPPGPAQWVQLSIQNQVLLIDQEQATPLTLFFLKYVFLHPRIQKVGVSTWDDILEVVGKFPSCVELKHTRNVVCFGELLRTYHTLEKHYSTNSNLPSMDTNSTNPEILQDMEITDTKNGGGTLFYMPTHRPTTTEQARAYELYTTSILEKTVLSSLHSAGQDIVPLSVNTSASAWNSHTSLLGALCYQQSRLPNIHAMGQKAQTARFTGHLQSKEEQMSAWDIRPQSRSQINYAAIDAHVSPVIYGNILKKYKQAPLETALRWLVLAKRLH